jgi:RND superfamily putative drug exporter
MLGALLIAPGNLLVSATLGVIVACVLAVVAALLFIPAALALLGTRVNSWQLWSARRENPWVRLSERLSRKPGIAVLLATLPLLFLSAPALALDTGPPNVENLPPDNSARKSYEEFERDRGAGWATPFEVTFAGEGPMTTDRRLRRLKRFQLDVAKLEGVDAVLGPASLLDRTRILRQITRSVVTGRVQIERLERSLRRLVRGTARLDSGLEQAASGSESLANGLGQAAAGTGQLAGGTAAAVPQTQQLANGVQATGEGADRLAGASGRASSGARRLNSAIAELTRILTEQDRDFESKLSDPLDSAQSDVQAALRNLGSASPAAQADPFVQRARQSISQALTALGTVQSNLSSYATELDANTAAAKEISRGMERLVNGLAQIASGSTQLDSGIARTASGATQLASGAGVLNAGVQQLNSGINQLYGGGAEGSGGAVGLASGLDRASAGANLIGRGLQRLLDNVVAVREANDRQERQLRRQGIDVGKSATSGYFVLAGIEGATRPSQANAGFAINTTGGGNTARVIVIPEGGAFDEDTQALRGPIEDLTDKTAKDLGGEGVVGGPAVLLDDFDEATSARFPLLVATLVIVTFLVLLLVFRAPVLALVAVLLNLVTVGAAVGVLILCFQTDPPLLGGPGYLDAIALSGIFAIIFGLSIDYEVFLLSRLVEGRALTGTTDGAIRYGLEKTATIITGAAAVMAFVFLAFAVSPVANTRQFGIGLTVAVVLDATVVRLILLPALIRLFGERTWAVPVWLDRILPRFQTH